MTLPTIALMLGPSKTLSSVAAPIGETAGPLPPGRGQLLTGRGLGLSAPAVPAG